MCYGKLNVNKRVSVVCVFHATFLYDVDIIHKDSYALVLS